MLESYFGYGSFRPLQEKAIDAILQQKDLLMIMPTGGGKSLCYQLPSLMMDGVTIVVSPLLALMYDQVRALKTNGIKAEMISSMQNEEEIQNVRERLINAEIKLLYVAPERFASFEFVNFLKSIKINFFVIDEAHCVSEWGHEFRADYRKLDLLRENFPTTSIAAFTATATSKVAEDIKHALMLHKPVEVHGKIFRENLHITVESRIKDGKKQLLEFLSSFKNESGIVYAFSRKQTEALAVFLHTNGIKAKAFHAGLPTHVKEDTYKAFVHDEIQVVVATIAFGMGIDKSNIRFVVHMNLPKTIENYYQEIGRAGRDGLKSEVFLLYSGSDVVMQREFIEQLEESPYKRNAFNKIEQMSRYATMEECRHHYIAAYFEDDIENCKDVCDNCIAPETKHSDITVDAQKLLSAIYRTNQTFGQAYVIDVLRGSTLQKILDNGHDQLSVYGIGEEKSRAYWERVVERLMELSALKRGEFRALVLDGAGMKILKNELKVFIKEERLSLKPKKEFVVHKDEDVDSEVFERLRILRAAIAKAEEKPAYIIFGDKTLKEMAKALPKTKEEMLEVNGIGEVKYQRYGEQFLELCRTL
ncbi:DNA helicase RecQ [Sulfurimonas sp. HSL-1716]|uniref:DNA helicase RecQ n=1 Tax=Hydrocurvibacter sulfurireducens TaxID=3131937 RepID=UPI0031F9C74B